MHPHLIKQIFQRWSEVENFGNDGGERCCLAKDERNSGDESKGTAEQGQECGYNVAWVKWLNS